MKIDHRSSITWLLEPNDIGVKYLATRDLMDSKTDGFKELQKKARIEGPIARVLDKMDPEGYWEQSGAGYYPKYTGTTWSIILLSQLGASIKMDERIAGTC